jgi:hypothetical protein
VISRGVRAAGIHQRCERRSLRGAFCFLKEGQAFRPSGSCDIHQGLEARRGLHSLFFHLAYRCYILAMTTVEDIQEANAQLPACELARFREWFEAFDADSCQ